MNDKPVERKPKPLYVKIKHKKECFIIFSDEYDKTGMIKEEISKIKDIPKENIKLYYTNKRLLEDENTNHDQQVRQKQILFVIFKNEKNNEGDNINEIMSYGE
jgi:hypothetical protein